MRTTPLSLLCLLTAGCPSSNDADRAAPVDAGPRVSFREVQVDGVGDVLAHTAEGWVGTTGWLPHGASSPTPWPTRQATAAKVAVGSQQVALVWSNGGASLGASPGDLTGIDVGEQRVESLTWADLDEDGTSELLVTFTASDIVRAHEADGTLRWEQRWGGDVAHIQALRGHARRLAHTDGIGLVVRTPDGEVVSRNRPIDAGLVRHLEVVTDVGSFDGPSLAVTHQRTGGAARVDLFSPDGASSRGTLRPRDLDGHRSGVTLPSGYRVTTETTARQAINVRFVKGDEVVFSQVLPQPSPWVQVSAQGDAAMVVTQDAVRAFEMTEGSAP